MDRHLPRARAERINLRISTLSIAATVRAAEADGHDQALEVQEAGQRTQRGHRSHATSCESVDDLGRTDRNARSSFVTGETSPSALGQAATTAPTAA